MGNLLQDFIYAGRMLRKSPAFSLVAVLSLSVGIAANTTIFSVINAVLLRPLPHTDPGRLVALYDMYSEDARGFSVGPAVTVGNFRDWRSQNTVFAEMAVFGNSDPATLTGGGEAERIRVQHVSPEIFRLLGADVAAGRTFVKEDGSAYQSSQVILSDAFWKSRFGSDRGVLGRAVTIDGQVVTIVGIMPPGFWINPYATKVDVWRALNLDSNPAIAANRHNRYLNAIARLKPGVTMEQSQVEMVTIASRLALAYPQTNKGWTVQLQPLHEAFFGGHRSVLYSLLMAVGFVLLIPCANVANLLMVRAAARRKETAIRSSVGASRLRLIRQWLAESVLLALISGFLGLVWAFWGIDLFRSLAPPWFVSGVDIRIDAKVLGFTLAIAFLTGILFGIAPALRASRTDLSDALKESPKGGPASRGRLRDLLAVSEIALALVLLIGAGLTIKSFLRLLQTDPGFQPENLLSALLFPTGPKYLQPIGRDIKRVTPQVENFYRQVLARVEVLPQVESAGIVSALPTRYQEFRAFAIAGRPAGQEAPAAGFTEISPNYFQVMRIPLIKGRYLSERDSGGSPWVVVINEAMARRFWPNEDPIGKQIHMQIDRGISEDRPREVVGIVGNVRHWLASEPMSVMYTSYLQHALEYPGGRANSHLRKTLVIRARSDPSVLTAAVRRAVAEVDVDQPAYDILTVEQLLYNYLSPGRFYVRLLGLFGAIALILAAIGIYGVVSYSVSQRRHEIGIRMALGANRADVVRLVLMQGLKLTSAGVVFGIAGALALTRFIVSALYGVTPTDSSTFAIVSLLLAAVALLASYLPARRAMKVDPVKVLRGQ